MSDPQVVPDWVECPECQESFYEDEGHECPPDPWGDAQWVTFGDRPIDSPTS